jgi:hypothetical protein
VAPEASRAVNEMCWIRSVVGRRWRSATTGESPFAWWSATTSRSASARRATPATRRSTTGSAVPHLLELGPLLTRQDFHQLGIHILLKLRHLLLLLRRQVETLLGHLRKDLAHAPRRSHARTSRSAASRPKPTWPAARRRPPRALTIGRGTARASEARWSAAVVILLLGREGAQFGLGDDLVLVGIGPIEQSAEPGVGDLGSGQLSVFVLVERHQLGHDVVAVFLTAPRWSSIVVRRLRRSERSQGQNAADQD